MRKNITHLYKKLDNGRPMNKQIFISSETKNISYAEKLVDDISDTYNIGAELYGNILVSVVEAVNNAIIHGNKLDKDKYVEINCNFENRYLYFVIRDQGYGFNLENISDPTSPENIENPHGRGIFLMRNLSDQIEFSDKGREVTLRFKV